MPTTWHVSNLYNGVRKIVGVVFYCSRLSTPFLGAFQALPLSAVLADFTLSVMLRFFLCLLDIIFQLLSIYMDECNLGDIFLTHQAVDECIYGSSVSADFMLT